MAKMLSLLRSFTCLFYLSLSYGNLDRVLKHYETLHHNTFRHHIHRRDIYTQSPTERSIEFESHGKKFRLMLNKTTSLFSSDFTILAVDGKNRRQLKIDPGIYRGHLADEPTSSSVSAFWDDDQTLTANIWTETDVFVIEPSWRHLPESPEYSMISYRNSDLNQKEVSGDTFCGNHILEDHVVEQNSSYGMSTGNKRMNTNENKRKKRNTGQDCKKTKKKFCPILLVADYRFYKDIGYKDFVKTTKYLVGVVEWVNEIFQAHAFGDCGSGFGLEIKNITIHEKPSNEYGHYNNDKMTWNSSQLLQSFSNSSFIDYSNYCLVHLFTTVPFNSGVLGMANVADSDGHKDSGLCSRKPDKDKGFLNTGWSTFVGRNNERILSLQAKLVVAHEFGHGWGSYHDPNNSSKCSPVSRDGKYLMHQNSVTGQQPNNKHFSTCSISAISKVLLEKFSLCFTEKESSFCGNYLKENGEACDEGPVHRFADISRNTVSCCDNKCQLKHGANCSDLLNACCEDCQIANSTKQCQNASDEQCTEASYCTGDSLICPEPAAKPNGTQCLKHGRCYDKKCLSLCEYNNKIPCFCSTVELSCKVCCKDHENDTCQPFSIHNDTAMLENVGDNIPCPLGSCKNGSCEIISDVSLQRAWNFIDIESVEAFVKFMRNNIVGTVIIISLLLWIPASCAVSYIDRKRAEKDNDEIDWNRRTNNSLIPDRERSSTRIVKKAGTIDRRLFVESYCKSSR